MSDHEANQRIDFELARKTVIESLQGMRFEDDAHFMVCIGNHKASQNMIFGCEEWVLLRLHDIVTKYPASNARGI